MSYEEFHKIARRKIRRKKWFLRHFALFIGCAVVFLISGITGMNFSWRHLVWNLGNGPLVFWLGIIIFHYLVVYGFPFTGALSGKWEEKEMKKELNKLYTSNPIDEEDYQGLTFEDRLELKELDRLKDKWEPDHYV